MVLSKGQMRAALHAASLLMSIPLAAQAPARASQERMPLPVPRPEWLDATPAEATVLSQDAATTPAPAPAAGPVKVASLPARMPLPVARPDWLDAPEAETSTASAPAPAVEQVQPAPARVASLPARMPLPIPRPDWLDASTADEESGVTRVPQTADVEPSAVDTRRVSPLHSLVDDFARRHGVPERLAHRIVQQESRYNPALKAKAHFGLMQVSLATAKSMGYGGDASGLLDAKTNLTYSMPYLANAWIVSGGNEEKARRLYMSGYYPEAKKKGLLKALRKADSPSVTEDGQIEAADAR